MKIIRAVEEIGETADCALALGAFDGLHRGHMAVISETLCREDLVPAVFTFEKSPSGAGTVLSGEDKKRLLREAGIRRLYSVNFQDVKDMEAEEFVRLLLEGCRGKVLCCGEDFRFGRGAGGDVALLKAACDRAGAELRVVSPVQDGGEKISSTRIRRAVEAGEIPLANRLLGREFGFSGKVVHGNHIGGPVLGTPTINQAMPADFVTPPFGVYAALAEWDGREEWGVANVGIKPTVGADRPLAETWLPEFSGDLYGKTIRLKLLEFIRPEKKFSSLDELGAEIRKNAEKARAVVERRRGRLPVENREIVTP